MAITIREQVDTANNTGAVSFTLGAGTAVGDLAVCIASNNFYTAANLLTPTGTAVTTWTLRHTQDGGTNTMHAKVWTGPVTTGGTSTVVTNWSTAAPDEERYGGVWILQSAPLFDTAAGTSGASSASHIAPTVTPGGQADDLLICHWGSAGLINYTIPGSMTARTERDVGTVNTYRSADEQLASASATGTRTATASTAKVYVAVSVLIKSSAAAAPTLWRRSRTSPAYRR